jgi:acetate kinase
MNILVLNAGSSTLKFRLLALDGANEEAPRLLVDGLIDQWHIAKARLKLSIVGKQTTQDHVAAESPAEAAAYAIRVSEPLRIDAIGHRVVHGGSRFIEPTRITPQVVQALREVSSLAPLHNANAIAGIEAGLTLLPGKPSVAVFDTAFHASIPDVAAHYAIPRDLSQQHALRRYGFHGISHQYVSQKLLRCLGVEARGTKLITCHLGNGASICAIRDGRSIDTSMGLTPMEGLVMGTRSGDIDPGLVLHLLSALKMSPAEVDHLLNHRSGLLGLSGVSADLREVQAAALAGNQHAQLALECFAYRARKYIGAYAAALGGLDAIAFSGGIGEHSPEMRASILRGLEFLHLAVDPPANQRAAAGQPSRISAAASLVQVWVIPTDEEAQIAQELVRLLPPLAENR